MTTRKANDRERGIIVVSGIPGAGKSTLAPLLARRFSRGVHIEADALHRMIQSGGRWPNEAPLEEGALQLRLRGKNSCLLAKSFCDAGFVAVIDDIVIGERLTHYADDLEPYPWSLAQLLPTLETVKARNRGRTAKEVYDQWSHLDATARATSGGLRLDTSELDPEQSVDRILAEIWRTGVVADEAL